VQWPWQPWFSLCPRPAVVVFFTNPSHYQIWKRPPLVGIRTIHINQGNRRSNQRNRRRNLSQIHINHQSPWNRPQIKYVTQNPPKMSWRWG
jgi:hypothetical protein